MRTFLLIAALVGMLGIALVVTLLMWFDIDETEISIHGIIAMLLGVVFSLGIGGGLMFLVFYSSRHGHDDGIGR